MRMQRWLTVLLVVMTGPMVLAAGEQDLAGVTPDQALLYFGWPGADACKQIAADTPMQKLLNEPQMKESMTRVEEQLRLFIKQQMAEEGNEAIHESLMTFLDTLWKYPAALVVFDVTLTEQGPDIQAGLLFKVGDKGPAFQQACETLLQHHHGAPAPQEVLLEGGAACRQMALLPNLQPVHYGVSGEYFIFAIGAPTYSKMVAALTGGQHLIDNADFAAARKKMGVDSARLGVNLYVNFTGALKRFDEIFPIMSGAGEQEQAMVQTAIEALGLRQLRSINFAMEAASGGYQSTLLFHTQGEPKGLWKMVSRQPVTDSDLKIVPEDATFMLVANKDLAHIYDEVFAIARAFAPPAPATTQPDVNEEPAPGPETIMQGAIMMANGVLGFRIKEDLLDSLGDTWVIYDAPSNGGFIITGLTIAVEVKNPDKIKQVFSTLTSKLQQVTHGEGVSIRTYKYGWDEISFVNFMKEPIPVAPAWTLKNNQLIIALYPQMVSQVIDRLSASEGVHSILDNADFQRGRRLLPPNPIVLTYVDTRKGVSDLYGLALPFASALFSAAQGEGLDLDISVMPSSALLTRHLFGDVSGAYADDEGVLFRSHGPLPISIPSLGSASPAVGAISVAILLPSLARAREQAKRTMSMSNLSQIGMGIAIYANDNKDQLPTDLKQLLEANYITSDILVSPNDSQGMDSYIYIAGFSRLSDISQPSSTILAYERGDIDPEGVNILFADYHVEFLDHLRFEELLRTTAEQLGDRYNGPRPWENPGDGM
ncbi:MAG: hypothetical protein HJJLKODD_01087 [Phycisphaerae bacterium]|nr:hypothetical protein [Phycisphaerae bacterium]